MFVDCVCLVLQNGIPGILFREDIFIFLLFDNVLINVLLQPGWNDNLANCLILAPMQTWIDRDSNKQLFVDKRAIYVSETYLLFIFFIFSSMLFFIFSNCRLFYGLLF